MGNWEANSWSRPIAVPYRSYIRILVGHVCLASVLLSQHEALQVCIFSARIPKEWRLNDKIRVYAADAVALKLCFPIESFLGNTILDRVAQLAFGLDDPLALHRLVRRFGPYPNPRATY